jgi:hypothetical protein
MRINGLHLIRKNPHKPPQIKRPIIRQSTRHYRLKRRIQLSSRLLHILIEIGHLTNQLLEDIVEDDHTDTAHRPAHVVQVLDRVEPYLLFGVAEAVENGQDEFGDYAGGLLVVVLEAGRDRFEDLQAGLLAVGIRAFKVVVLE